MRSIYPILLLLVLVLSQTALRAQFGTNNRLLFTTDLAGQQEIPAVTTDARGIATVLISEDRTTMSIHAVFSGLSGPITNCHFHIGTDSEVGPVTIPLFGNITGNRLRADIPVTADFLANALKEKIYLNVHTAANPTGEIRGQITLMRDNLYAAAMSGANEVPPVATTGSGLFKMSILPGYFYSQYQGEVNGLSGTMTAAHIHEGAAGVVGPVLVPLPLASSATTIVGEIDLTTVVPNGFYQKLDNGTLYVNAHTAANTGGEIRGQLINFGPIAFESTLNGDQETPPVESPGFGLAVAGVNSTLDSVTYMVGVNGLTPTNAHFHLGGPSVAGPVIIPLQLSALPNFYFGKVAITGDQLTQLLNGNIYVNIHTAANPNGEIRGQMQPLLRRIYTFDLCGEQEVPPTNSTGQGTGWISTDYLNTQLTYRFIVDGLSGPATAAHVHDGAMGVAGPVYLPVFTPSPVSSGQFEIDGNVATKLESGNTYMNVHTAANPGGEIRGQILRELSCAANVATSDLQISALSIMPNPTSGRTEIRFYAETDFKGHLMLTDLTGKLIQEQNRTFYAGDHYIQMDLTGLPTGLYIARLRNEQGAQHSFKLLKE